MSYGRQLLFGGGLAVILAVQSEAGAQETPSCPFLVDVQGTVGIAGVTHLSIQDAINDLPNPGPCLVTVKPGTFLESVLISEANTLAESEAERIVIMADVPADAAVSDDEKVVVSPPDRRGNAFSFAFKVQRSKFITIKSFDIRGAREAVVLRGLGGKNGNEDIVLDGNDIHDNGTGSHLGAITVGRNSSRTWVVNNLIRLNAGNGLLIEGSGSPPDDTVYVVNNTVFSNGWNGLRVTRKRVVYLVNNLVVGNGTAELPKKPLEETDREAGRWGLFREGQGGQGVLQRTTLLGNMFYRNGEGKPPDQGDDIANVDRIFEDGSDDGNYTTTGSEAASPAIIGCTFADCTGASDFAALFIDPNSNFRLAPDAPAIDRGLDSLDHNGMERVPAVDFEGEARPQDGNGDSTERTDIGYDEATEVVRAFRAIADCSPTSGTIPLPVKFRSRGEFAGGSIIRYRWDFEGDGVFDTSDAVARDFLRTFNQPGVFVSVLEVTNNFGETATDTCTITAAAGAPVAIVDVDPSNGPVPLTVTFNGTGLKEGGAIILHSYDFEGNGVFDFETSDIGIPQPDAINFVINHATCGSNNQFDFYLNDVLIHSASGTVGCFCNSLEPTFLINDPSALSNWIPGGGNTLRVDAGSSLGVAYIRAEFDPEGTVCVFDGVTNGDCANRNLCSGFQFGGSFSAPAQTSVTRSTVEHTYVTEGTFNAVFLVTDDEGQTATASATTSAVRVGPPGTPIVRAAATPTEGDAPLGVTFSGTASDDDGVIVLWEWDFDGDGTFDFSSATSPSTTFSYTDAGTFAAALRVTDDSGLTSRDVIEIEVGLVATLSIPDDTFNPVLGETAAVNTSISAAAPVRILLLDEDRVVVRNLVDEVRPAGSYSDPWDGRDNAGDLLAQAPYFAVLEYEVSGRVERIDLTDVTGGLRYNPSRNRLPSIFRPFEDDLLTINFTIPSSRGASEVTAFIGQFFFDTRFVTLLEREPLGVGTHTIHWDGTDPQGGIAEPPPGDRFLFGIFGFTLPDNAIMLQSAPVLSNVSVDPNFFDPSTPDFISPDDPTATVVFDIDRVSNVELTVTNLQTGLVLRRITQFSVTPGTQVLEWDGRAENGLFVDKGDYRLTLRAIDSTGSVSINRFALVRVFY